MTTLGRDNHSLDVFSKAKEISDFQSNLLGEVTHAPASSFNLDGATCGAFDFV